MALRVLPLHSILEQGNYFLRLRMEHRMETDQAEYRAVLDGDAGTKPLCDWTANIDEALAAFDAEKNRYEGAA